MKRQPKAILLALLSLVWILSACLVRPASGPSTTPLGTPTPSGKSTPFPAGQTGQSGGTFTRLWSDPPTLDPHLTSDTASAGIVVEIFSGLVAIDYDLNIIPDLAERWDISSDGKVYTFSLRRGAKFHNGREVTADDFKYSFERVTDPRLESTVADLYLGDVVGVKDKLNGLAKEISGIKALDKYTLQVTFDAPKAYVLAKLTYPTAYVVDKNNVEASRVWTRRPNGTGPFKLAEWTIGEKLVLERNENFYRGPARLDRAVFILSGGVPMAMYENGEIDFTGVGLADLSRVQDPKDPLNRELVTYPPQFDLSYVGFNVNQPPFDDVRVRQAFTLAVDKKLIAEQVLSNLLVPAYGILPPRFPGYNPNLKGLTHDPARAKQLIAESKYGSVASFPRIVLTVPGTGGAVGLDTEAMLEMWKTNLGVEVEVQQVEWATFLQDLHRNKYQLFGEFGWQADYPDPEDFLDILFYSKSANNYGRYVNTEVDRLLERARVEPDVNARLALYQQAEEKVVNDAPIIPQWYSGDRFVLVKPYVKGYRFTPLIVPKLKDVYIEGKGK